MNQFDSKSKTPAEMQELCEKLNFLHKCIWCVIAVVICICALFYNPGHLITAALCLLFSRAEWEVNDLKALSHDE